MINDWAFDIVETKDHGFITGGWGGDAHDEFELMKIDKSGSIVWSKNLKGDGIPSGYFVSFAQLKDGTYIAVGRAYNGSNQNTLLVRFDENGTVIWNKLLTYPNGLSVIPNNVCATADGGFVMVGSHQPFVNFGGPVVIKLDADGKLIWTKGTIGGIASNLAITESVKEINGILYIIGAFLDNGDGLVIQLNSSDGAFLEGTGIKVNNLFTMFKYFEIKDSKVYISGYTRNIPINETKNFVLILDSKLEVLKAHKFELGFKRVWEEPAMAVTADGSIIIAESNEYASDLLLCKITYDGKIKWKRQYNRPGSQITLNLKRTPDDGVIGVGTSNVQESFYNNPGNDVFIYKADSLGFTGGCAVIDPDVVISPVGFVRSAIPLNLAPISFSVLSLASTNINVVIPVTSLCAKVDVSTCTELTLTGRDTICNLLDTATYKAVKNSTCNAPVGWLTDTAYVQKISSTDSTLTIRFIKPGTTKLIAAISNGCGMLTDTIEMHIYNAPGPFNLGPDLSICKESIHKLHPGSGFENYLWQDGSTDSTYLVRSPGVYHVSAKSCGGAVYTDTIKILMPQQATGFLKKDTAICEGDSATISSLINFREYLWSTGETKKQIIVSIPGTYWLETIDSNGCKGKEYTTVNTKADCVVALYFPSVFTPNNDGLNDYFKGIAFGRVKKYNLSVYNRYGNIIFKTSDISKGWDGKMNGILQNSGSFVWYCEYQLGNQKLQTKKGVINLVH